MKVNWYYSSKINPYRDPNWNINRPFDDYKPSLRYKLMSIWWLTNRFFRFSAPKKLNGMCERYKLRLILFWDQLRDKRRNKK